MFKTVGEYYEQKANDPANIRTMDLKKGKFSIQEKKCKSPPLIDDEHKKPKIKKYVVPKEKKQPKMSDIRKTGFNLDVAKKMVIGTSGIDESVHRVRKNIFYISRMKVKNQFQNDMITEQVQQGRTVVHDPGPAIVPDPNYPKARKSTKESEVRELKKSVKKYLAVSPVPKKKGRPQPAEAYSV